MYIRAMTYNILDGGKSREDELLAVIRAAEPDIVFLQEVMYPRLVVRFARELKMNAFFARGNVSRHMALLTRFPIRRHESFHPFPPVRTTIMEATVELAAGKRLHLFGVHLVPYPIYVFEWARLWEARLLIKRVEPYRTAPCLIAGDFNAITPGDPTNTRDMALKYQIIHTLNLRRFPRFAMAEIDGAGFVDCFRQLHPDAEGYTIPSPEPLIRIDYIFASAVLAEGLQDCRVVTAPDAAHTASDHYPVVAEFQI